MDHSRQLGQTSGDGSVSAGSIGRDANIHNYYGQASLPPKPPVLKLLPLMFDRDVQDEQVVGYVEQCLAQGRQVMPIILCGPQQESPAHLVERYTNFILREVVQGRDESQAYEQLTHPVLEWPRKNASLEQRFQMLLGDLCRKMIRVSTLDESQIKTELKTRFETQGKHQILYYFLTEDRASRQDAELIRRWIDFWLELPLDSTKVTVSIMFCLHSESSWLPLRFDWTHSCFKALRRLYQDEPAVLLLDRLNAPRKRKDPYNWAFRHCQRAWKIAHWQDDTPFPLDTGVLHKGAEQAFGWFPSRPLKDLMPKLSKAVQEAHKA